MRQFKHSMICWWALLSLPAVVSVSGQTSPGSDAGNAGPSGSAANPAANPAGTPAEDTVQLHRVVYVHQGEDGNLLERKKFVDRYAAPPVIFSGGDDEPMILPPPPQFSPAQLQKQWHAADDARNWMLLTPEEILGVNEKKDNPDDPDRHLSAEERYVKRQSAERMGTNDSSGDSLLKNHDPLNPSGSWHGENPAGPDERMANRWMHGGLNELMDNGREAGTDPNSPDNATDSAWRTSIWGNAPTEDAAQAALKQKAEMQQFNQLLAPAADPQIKPAGLSEGTPADATLANPLLEGQTRANTSSQDYSLLKQNIGRPEPLPTLIPSWELKPKEEPRRKPAPPPWTLKPGQFN